MMDNTRFEMEGTVYTMSKPGYYYKEQNGKRTRISKAEWEQMFEQFTNDLDEEWDAEDEIKEREAKQAESDKEAEQVINKPKKKRKSKDIAFATTIMLADDKIADVTLTAKQVSFLKEVPNDDFFEHGDNSAIWIDVFCDTVADLFSPMAVGAMISTLREKDIIYVVQDKINGKKCKFFTFTELGKRVIKELGLV